MDRLPGQGPRARSPRNGREQGREGTVRAQIAQGRGGLLVQTVVRRAARHTRLPGPRASLSHRHSRRHPGAGCKPEIASSAIQDPDRHAVREWRRSEEHTSELQSLMRISYAVFCLKKKKTKNKTKKEK